MSTKRKVRLASQDTYHNSWKQHVHYLVHNISLPTPSTEIKDHKFSTSIFQIHFIIINHSKIFVSQMLYAFH